MSSHGIAAERAGFAALGSLPEPAAERAYRFRRRCAAFHAPWRLQRAAPGGACPELNFQAPRSTAAVCGVAVQDVAHTVAAAAVCGAAAVLLWIPNLIVSTRTPGGRVFVGRDRRMVRVRVCRPSAALRRWQPERAPEWSIPPGRGARHPAAAAAVCGATAMLRRILNLLNLLIPNQRYRTLLIRRWRFPARSGRPGRVRPARARFFLARRPRLLQGGHDARVTVT